MKRTILPRLLAALVVGLATLALTLGAVGAATARGEASGDLPQTFRLEPAFGGDAASFRTTFTVDGASQRPSETQAMWGPERLWLAPDGTFHAVHELVSVDPSSGGYASVGDSEIAMPNIDRDVVETATGRALATTVGHGSGAAGAATTDGVTERERTVLTASTTFAVGGQGCGLGSAVRAGVPTAGALVLPCHGADVAYEVTTGFVQGIPTVRFRHEAPEGWSETDYHATIPFPLRTAQHAQWEGKSYDAETLLVGLRRGVDPWDSGLAVPPPAALPTLELAPRTPWGMDDTGLEHPYRLSEAWTGARDDATFPGFRTYLAAHPDADLVDAEYAESIDGETTTHTWFVEVADGGSSARLVATRTEGPLAADVWDLLGTPSPLGPTTSTSYSLQEGQATRFLDTTPMPDRLPTARWVVAYHDAWVAAVPASQPGLESAPLQVGPANAYGLAKDFPSGSWIATATQSHEGLPDNGDGPARSFSNTTLYTLAFAPDGTPASLEETRRWEANGRSSIFEAPSEPVVLHGSTAPAGLQLAGIAWAAPSAPAATGAALLSAIAGAAYLLWPSLKGGAVGLFSRVHGARLLEHPTRRAIADAVGAQPGIHMQALGRLLGLANGTLEHHVRRLEDGGHLVRRQAGKFACLFPSSAQARDAPKAVAVKSEGARRVLDAVRGNPGASSTRVAEVTGLDAGTVSYHVSRLEDAGLITAVRVGRSLSLTVA